MGSRPSDPSKPVAHAGRTSPKRSKKATERTGPAAKRAQAAERQERVERAARADAKAQLSVQDAVAELGKLREAAEGVKSGRFDSWTNALTGLGIAGRDWRTATTLDTDPILDRQQIDDLYTQDNLAAKIVDEIPENSVRRWVRLAGQEGEDVGKFQREVFKHMNRLHAKQRFLQWLRLGRKDGGAVMLIGADDGGALDKPLKPKRTRDINHLHCLERWAVVPDVIDLDPFSPNFAEPLYYTILPRALQTSAFAPRPQESLLRGQPNAPKGQRVHYSRMFVHEGLQVSERRKIAQRGWGFSILQRSWGPIMNYRVLWAHISTLFKHVAQTVLKLAGYAELQGQDFEQVVQSRIAQIQLARSTLNVVPLDADDSLEEQTLSGVSGALEIFKYAQEDLAQAADMPLTQLFGHRPAGFSSDDDAGMRNFHQRVRGVQEDFLLEPLTMLVELICETYGIATPESWSVEFNPLEEPSEAEQADRDYKKAQRLEILVKNLVVSPSEARETLRADPKNELILEAGPAPHDAIANKNAPVLPGNTPTPAQAPPEPTPNDPGNVPPAKPDKAKL